MVLVKPAQIYVSEPAPVQQVQEQKPEIRLEEPVQKSQPEVQPLIDAFTGGAEIADGGVAKGAEVVMEKQFNIRLKRRNRHGDRRGRRTNENGIAQARINARNPVAAPLGQANEIDR